MQYFSHWMLSMILYCLLMQLGLNLSSNCESDYILDLTAEVFKHFPKTCVKLVTSLRHFYGKHRYSN